MCIAGPDSTTKMSREDVSEVIWRALPPEVTLRGLSFLPHNALAYAGRLACKDAAQLCAQPKQCTLLLSEPLPPSPQAFDLALAKAQQGVSALSFRRQLNLFSTAAASGSQANLELVWALLRPRVCPELLSSGRNQAHAFYADPVDPGVAAATAGHLHLLPWLLAHCPGLVDPAKTLAAVAGHCDLAALQEAWDVLRERWDLAVDAIVQGERRTLAGWHQQLGDSTAKSVATCRWGQVLDAAAACKRPGGSAKLEWVIQAGGGSSLVTADTVAAAMRLGHLDRVRWLLREFPWVRVGPGKGDIIAAALELSDLGVTEWLVDEVGCTLPKAEDLESCSSLGEAAARSGSMAKLRWLADRGLPLTTEGALSGALAGGHMEVLRFLREEAGNTTALEEFVWEMQAAASGNPCAVAWMLQGGNRVSFQAYSSAAACGDQAMVKWLVREASQGVQLLRQLDSVILAWPESNSADDEELFAVASFMLKAAGRDTGGMWGAAQRAAERGYLPLLRLLLEHPPGYAYSKRWLIPEAAAEGGCENVVKYLVLEPSTGPRGWSFHHTPPDTWICSLPALINGDLATANLLHGMLGLAWPRDALSQAVRKGCFLSALQWMVEQGAPVGPQEVRQALEGAKRAEVREWLVSLLPCDTMRNEAMRFLPPGTTAGRLSRRNSL